VSLILAIYVTNCGGNVINSVNPHRGQREIGIGAQILLDLNLRRVRLLTNHPRRVLGLEGYGIEIVDQIPIAAGAGTGCEGEGSAYRSEEALT
jgi:GTP cyclohydrolase II